ncbi:hypothetical protein HYX07_02915 [Candidatus Woesearchaeota archaeon]|nr:hypothetical protein [Candidatus Woesearchaeota archaeon]
MLGYCTWSRGEPISNGSCDDIGSLLLTLKSSRVRLSTKRVFDQLPRRVEKDASVIEGHKAEEIDRAILQMLAA